MNHPVGWLLLAAGCVQTRAVRALWLVYMKAHLGARIAVGAPFPVPLNGCLRACAVLLLERVEQARVIIKRLFLVTPPNVIHYVDFH